MQAWKEEGRHTRRPNAVMKQKILVFLALMMVIALCGTAMAENVSVIPEVSVQLSQNRFNGPGPVDVTITVSNNSSTDMAGPCALFDPNGVRVIVNYRNTEVTVEGHTVPARDFVRLSA